MLESTRVLLERAAGGQEEALDELFRRYLPALKRWACGRLPLWARGVVDTDDLVQETLLRTLRRVDEFEPRHSGAFQAYLRKVLLNRIREETRRVQRRPSETARPGEPMDDSPSPVERAIGHEAMARYETALEKLRPLEREAVLARIELGLSYAEIAEITEQPSPDASRMMVSRALMKLAQRMASA